jgi:hypothetical protein
MFLSSAGNGHSSDGWAGADTSSTSLRGVACRVSVAKLLRKIDMLTKVELITGDAGGLSEDAGERGGTFASMLILVERSTYLTVWQ